MCLEIFVSFRDPARGGITHFFVFVLPFLVSSLLENVQTVQYIPLKSASGPLRERLRYLYSFLCFFKTCKRPNTSFNLASSVSLKSVRNPSFASPLRAWGAVWPEHPKWTPKCCHLGTLFDIFLHPWDSFCAFWDQFLILSCPIPSLLSFGVFSRFFVCLCCDLLFCFPLCYCG